MPNLKDICKKLSPTRPQARGAVRHRVKSTASAVGQSPESAKSPVNLPLMAPITDDHDIPEIHIDRHELELEKQTSSMADLLHHASIRSARNEYPWMTGGSASSLATGPAPTLKESAQDFVNDMRLHEARRQSILALEKPRDKNSNTGSPLVSEGHWLSGVNGSPKFARHAPISNEDKAKQSSQKSHVDLRLETASCSPKGSIKSEGPSAETSPGLTEFSSADSHKSRAGALPIDSFTPEEWIRFLNMRKMYAAAMIMRKVVATILGFKADLPASYEKSMDDAQHASERLLILIQQAELRKKFEAKFCDPVARAKLDVERTGGSLERLAHRYEHWLEYDIKEGVDV